MLLVFCASHISEQKRLHLFDGMLQSYHKQTLKIPLYVSMTYDNQLYSSIKTLVKRHKCSYIQFFIHSDKMHQFQHFQFLAQQIDSLFLNSAWCIFADDDDFVHPRRNQYYNTFLKTMPRAERCFVCPSMMYSCWTNNNINESQLIQNVMKGEHSYVHENSYEYVNFCVRLSLLRKFCDFMQTHQLIHTKQCDVVLSMMLFHMCKKRMKPQCTWLYAYNQSSSHSRVCASTGVEYYVRHYKDAFLDKLRDAFKFDWSPNFIKGAPIVYSLDKYQKYTKLQRIVKDNNIVTLHGIWDL